MAKEHSILRFERFVVEQSVYPPRLYMAPHTDKLSRISIILDGELREYSGSKEVTAKAGSLVIKPNHAVHENIFGDKPVKSLSISFHDDLLLTNSFNKWQWINHPKVNVLGIKLWAEMRLVKSEKAMMNCLDDFFSALALLKYDTEGKPVFWQEQLKELLEKELSEPENIQMLSQKLSLHRVYMARAFKKKYGVSPVEFRKYIRVAAALLDLSLTSKSLASVAYDAGFSDQSHMNREVKYHTGSTPAAF
ncbi:MAG TPA: AraC family transcriptional regulator, partial [Chitinophagaceae bacterium]|nr:AraC family transcriptional regulator [Chitinophagaceae bacterium]